jgi:hypothetical protein
VELNSTAGEMCTERVFFFSLGHPTVFEWLPSPLRWLTQQQRVMYFFRLLL